MFSRCALVTCLVALQAICGFGDLPVHCLADDAVGTWRFMLSAPSSARSSCGHQHPDNPVQEPRLAWNKARKPDFEATLQLPNTVSVEGDAEGSWAMVGDEGFEVRVKGMQFFAFFGFDQLPVDVGSEHLNLAMQKRYSHCGETMEGWYRTEGRDEWGCYVATKGDDADSFVQRTRKRSHQAVLAGSLNGQTLRGSREGHRLAARNGLPLAWDWRNVSGQSWVDASVSQGICGSCHTISTIQMLSARHRISKANPKLPPFSVSFPLYCNEYNQGCGAGFPFLAAKWSEDVGLLPERCAPAYSADDAESGICSATCDLHGLAPEERLRASDHRYVGGYIGGADKDAVKEELVSRGPLVVSFRSGRELQEYTGGIFYFDSSVEGDPDSTEAPSNGPQGFVGASHSALLVGFGSTSTGEAYWIVQNSWGPDWGEQGGFRISEQQARERGLEAMAVAADVVLDTNGADDPRAADSSSDGPGGTVAAATTGSDAWPLGDFVERLASSSA